MEFNEKFCPVCKNKNERGAIVCIRCGASLEEHHWGSPAVTLDSSIIGQYSAKITESPIDDSMIPDDGIAIYAEGTLKPIYLWFEKELVFGRKGEEPSEDALLDLSELGGYQAGISRRHAMIRKGENGCEVIDLGSTNGSWLNDERLIPNRPVPLESGSQLRFGRLCILVLYRCTSKKKKSRQPG